MNQLKLRLSHLEDARISVVAYSYATSDSVVPFDKGTRRITVLKALNAERYDPKDYSADEQKWMVENGLLTADKHTFHSDMRANIGKALYKTLFPEESNTKKALNSLTFKGEELHIQVEVEGDVGQHRLFDYPWELLSDERGFLIEYGINISRYIAYEALPPNLPPLRRINVLLVSPRASDMENDLFDLSDEECSAVQRGLEQARSTRKTPNAQGEVYIQIDELSPPVTFRKLSQYVLEHTGEDTPHVIHFDGHGHFGVLCRNTLPDIGECKTFNSGIREKCKNERCAASLANHQGYLLFKDDSGRHDYVSAQDIAALLGAANRNNSTGHSITLVVLSACKSGLALAKNSVFNGVAQRLISQRIPAVVGMAFTSRVDSTIAFMEHFYLAIRQKLSLVTAVSWGRYAMRLDSNQWYRPVLYMRWQDNEGGQIFAKQPETAPTTEYSEKQQTTNQIDSSRQNLSILPVTGSSQKENDKNEDNSSNQNDYSHPGALLPIRNDIKTSEPSLDNSGLNQADHSQEIRNLQMCHVTPLRGKFLVKPWPHGLLHPPGYLYLDQINDRSGELFYREQDGHVALLFPRQAEDIPPFLIDKYTVTNLQFCTFLNDLLDKGFARIDHLSGQKAVCCNDKNGQLLAVDARWDYWKPKQLTTRSWGITHQDGKWQPLTNCDLLPATLVSWQGAHLYSLWAHRLLDNDASPSCLPTSQLWRYAAQFDPTTRKARFYPWGNEWNRSYVNYAGSWVDKEVPTPIDRRREQENNPRAYRRIQPRLVTDLTEGCSSIGCVQLIGNVWEWCSDSPHGDPKSHIIKGGACNSSQEHCNALVNESWHGESEYIGFRCLFTLV